MWYDGRKEEGRNLFFTPSQEWRLYQGDSMVEEIYSESD